MTVLDRYVSRSFFYGFLIALVVMMTMIFSLDLMINLDEFTENKQLSGWEVGWNILDYYGNQFFFYFGQLEGLLVLTAGCITVGRMTRANELTALLASGVPLQRILRPIIGCAAVCAFLWIINSELIIPNIAQKLTRAHDDPGANRTMQITLFREEMFAAPGEPEQDLLFNAQQFYPFRNPPVILGLTVISRENGRAGWHLRADRAWWNENRQAWQLDRGIRFTPPSAPSSNPAEPANEDLIFERRPQEEFRTTLTPQELALRQQSQWMKFLSISQLNRMAQRSNLSQLQARELLLNRHGRFTEPIIGILTTIIGCSFFLRRGPANLVIQTTKCLAVCGLIFVTQFGLRSEFASNVVLVSWIPLFLSAGIAGWLYGNVKS